MKLRDYDQNCKLQLDPDSIYEINSILVLNRYNTQI